ncbi:MAG: hypothetical protein H0T89_01520 [Deltaproteobacteria bacterium]|nr:hypothetical protein [Deltaproteobacteria bacterium]MDQ3297673.1 hypothetical protein [Myxococcota bacterium]
MPIAPRLENRQGLPRSLARHQWPARPLPGILIEKLDPKSETPSIETFEWSTVASRILEGGATSICEHPVRELLPPELDHKQTSRDSTVMTLR